MEPNQIQWVIDAVDRNTSALDRIGLFLADLRLQQQQQRRINISTMSDQDVRTLVKAGIGELSKRKQPVDGPPPPPPETKIEGGEDTDPTAS